MIEIGKKYGCLTVLDLGEAYRQTEKYSEYREKAEALKAEVKPYIEEREKLKRENPTAYEEEKGNYIKDAGFHSKFCELNYTINTNYREYKEVADKLKPHYKCVCKCGKMHFYNEKTLESNPKYCIYPVPISTRHTYSVSAQNATYHKRQKYEGFENVILADKDNCIPSEEYCDYYNTYKEKQLQKNAEKLATVVAALPRINAKNYDVDFSGKQYESLSILECVDDHLESKPTFSFSQSHKKHWHTIKVYKQYRCKCSLCGKEQLINCDKFGIFPPTEYGYNAYNGYWSDAYCDCHPISSFQWIVCKLLFESDVKYAVEYSFSDLYGNRGVNLLRFDFVIFDDSGDIKCLIECQGEQHYRPVDEFGGKSSYNQQVEDDELKRKYAAKHGIPLLIISYKNKRFEKVKEILEKEDII